MATRIIAGKTVQVNEEGFLTDPSEWTKEIAAEIAKDEGVAELTANHWKVIDFCREASKGLGGKVAFDGSRLTGCRQSTGLVSDKENSNG